MKKLILPMLFGLLLIAGPVMAQEYVIHENVTTWTKGFATYTNEQNILDNDFDTYATALSSGTTSYPIYTVPKDHWCQGAIWEVKDDGGVANVSLNNYAFCIRAYPNYVNPDGNYRLGIQYNTGESIFWQYLVTDSGYANLREAGDNQIYEERLYTYDYGTIQENPDAYSYTNVDNISAFFDNDVLTSTTFSGFGDVIVNYTIPEYTNCSASYYFITSNNGTVAEYGSLPVACCDAFNGSMVSIKHQEFNEGEGTAWNTRCWSGSAYDGFISTEGSTIAPGHTINEEWMLWEGEEDACVANFTLNSSVEQCYNSTNSATNDTYYDLNMCDPLNLTYSVISGYPALDYSYTSESDACYDSDTVRTTYIYNDTLVCGYGIVNYTDTDCVNQETCSAGACSIDNSVPFVTGSAVPGLIMGAGILLTLLSIMVVPPQNTKELTERIVGALIVIAVLVAVSGVW